MAGNGASFLLALTSSKCLAKKTRRPPPDLELAWGILEGVFYYVDIQLLVRRYHLSNIKANVGEVAFSLGKPKVGQFAYLILFFPVDCVCGGEMVRTRASFYFADDQNSVTTRHDVKLAAPASPVTV